ncbi:MAG TPA: hypothetical protein ENH21_03295 [Chromatiales bacterium]|nr:hypothetical protein [Chromatiales bacterium]HEX22436.1 hypothetical protein [Chromatiales bacterium]
MNMLNSSIKTISILVFLSAFGLWGCVANETRTSPVPVDDAVQAETKAIAEATEDSASTAAQGSQVEKPDAASVETMPAKEARDPAISVESMPAASPAVTAVTTTEVATDKEPGKVVSAAPAISVKPMNAGPGQHVVTLAKKDPSHPAYGKGHAMGFSVDGVPGKSIILERGKTYTFVIKTDPRHDVYLSSKEIGWGSAPVVEGVQGANTYKGTMTFTPGKNTPDKVYYACRNHPYMGATLYIVEPGETVEIEAVTATTAPQKTQVSEAKVKQKLMFADMMINGKGAKRVLASNNGEAKRLLASAKKDLAASREKLLAGALPEALTLADQVVKGVGAASKMVPSEDVIAQLSQRHDELLHEIEDFEASYDSNYARMAKAGGVPKDIGYDKARVASLKAEAQSLASKGDYAKANAKLEQAQAIVTRGLHKMLDSKTLVYELKFDSPADEYEYELKRFTGYEELIPVAVEMKKPAAGALKLMDSFLDKARKRRDEAKAKATEGDYGAALGMLQQATKTVRRALRMVGVSQ